jgi:hypothetical protein
MLAQSAHKMEKQCLIFKLKHHEAPPQNSTLVWLQVGHLASHHLKKKKDVKALFKALLRLC